MAVRGHCRAILVGVVAILLISAAVSAKVTITVQYRGGDTRARTVAAWIEEFEAMHPDINVEWLQSPSGYTEKTIMSWAAGTGPDVTEIWGDWAQEYARAGVLMDLRPYVERDFTDEDIADFYPVAWDAATLKFGDNAGILFRIPRDTLTTVYHYNKDMFQQAGLAYPSELDAAGQWTYPVLRQTAKKLTVSDGNQIKQWGFTTDTDAFARLAVWIRAFGGDWFDPQNPYDFTGDEGPAVEAMTLLQKMIWEDQSTTPDFGFGSRAFRTGSVAMCEDGSHALLGRYDREIGDSFEWNIAAVPVGRNGRKAYNADGGMAIWRDTPHPEAAWQFVKFVTSRRGMEIATQHEGLSPGRQSAFPFYRNYMIERLGPDFNLDAISTNLLDSGLPSATYLVGDVGAISDTLRNVLEAVMERGEKPYVQAIAEVSSLIEELTRRNVQR